MKSDLSHCCKMSEIRCCKKSFRCMMNGLMSLHCMTSGKSLHCKMSGLIHCCMKSGLMNHCRKKSGLKSFRCYKMSGWKFRCLKSFLWKHFHYCGTLLFHYLMKKNELLLKKMKISPHLKMNFSHCYLNFSLQMLLSE
jgi:hypothetical protein